jgi:hypothetical protein
MSTPLLAGLDDPISEGAAFMRAAADSLCDRGESSREPCHAYHRAQLYLRMIGAAGESWAMHRS